jgi:hypothetical protein
MSNNPQLSQPLRVFLCHSSGDKEAVRALYRRLREDDIEPWLDEEEILPGQDWEHEIAKAVRTVDAVIVCLSRESVSKTGYVQKEIRFALDKADEQPEGVIFIIPLKLEPCEVPYRLHRWHWVNYFESQGYERLLRALRSRATKFDVPGTVSLGDEPHKKQIEKTFREKLTDSGSDLPEPAHIEQAGAIKTPIPSHQDAATSDIPGTASAAEAPPQLFPEPTTDHSPSAPLSLEQPPLDVSSPAASSIKLKAREAIHLLQRRAALLVFAVIVFLALFVWAILHRRAMNQPPRKVEGGEVESASSNTGKVTQTVTNSSSTPDLTRAASPVDTPVASGVYNNWVYKQTLSGHSDYVWSVAFSPDSKTLATGSWDHTVRLWDAHTGTLKRKLDHGGTVYRIAFSPDGQTLASVGWRSVVKLWDAQTGALIRTIGYGDSGYSYSVAFSPDGMLLGVGNYSGINFWDMRTHKNVRMSKGHIQDIYIIDLLRK